MSYKNFLFLDQNLLAYAVDAKLALSGSEGLHAAKVMRLEAGEKLLLTDTHANQAVVEVTANLKNSLELRLIEHVEKINPKKPSFALVQALAKAGRDEAAIETATELGIAEIIPWQANRSIVQWNPQKALKGESKWRAIIHAAVKQSRRSTIPQLMTVVNSSQLVQLIEKRSKTLTVVLHESAKERVSTYFHPNFDFTKFEQILIIVGPEGGISDEELRALQAHGAVSMKIGDEILRSSTAGIAVLSYLSAISGRWQ